MFNFYVSTLARVFTTNPSLTAQSPNVVSLFPGYAIKDFKPDNPYTILQQWGRCGSQ
ncbi:hypothetical protein JB92DRAFT_2993049 [Gautieria morchelliformis]|nr:hypothetical protein JB92DRAFT_2993049 [Gautieria morchelliformis]